ncbi:hypothetical protein M3Y96_00482400 [Aphelenchoides besseyi]|nr:hypothetical protein M3Y96_00482400 [Aphelenchoides besseyi]
MDIHRFWMVGIAFVAMSMFGLVHAGFSFQDEHPVYTADGTAGTATLELTEDKVKFTIEKQGTGSLSEMEMTLGGCMFKITYIESDDQVSFKGGSPVSLESSVTASATSSAVSYGGQSGKCEGAIKFEKVGGKFKTDVSFDYPKTDHPPLKFTFTNAQNFTEKNEGFKMTGGYIAGAVSGGIALVILAVVIAFGMTWCLCWCEGCCWNDEKRCSIWNRQKKKRMKAKGLDKKKDNDQNKPKVAPVQQLNQQQGTLIPTGVTPAQGNKVEDPKNKVGQQNDPKDVAPQQVVATAVLK